MSVSPELVQVGLLVWAFPGGGMGWIEGVVKSKEPCGPTFCRVDVEVTVDNPFAPGQKIKQTLHLNSRQIKRRVEDKKE